VAQTVQIDPEVVAAIRVLAGFSQAALARECGISVQYMSDIERGRRRGSPAVAKRIAQALGVPVRSILITPDDDEHEQGAA
jgi:transcriptional regulator with XRE-family HTH domain